MKGSLVKRDNKNVLSHCHCRIIVKQGKKLKKPDSEQPAITYRVGIDKRYLVAQCFVCKKNWIKKTQ